MELRILDRNAGYLLTSEASLQNLICGKAEFGHKEHGVVLALAGWVRVPVSFGFQIGFELSALLMDT